jgi:uncharacterized protein with FMN-binding domain
MRRSTAAAVGTLTGAALIVGVRLSVTPPAAPAAAPAADVADNSTPSPTASAAGKSSGSGKSSSSGKSSGSAKKTGLKDGDIQGKKVQYAYGAIQVTLKIDGGSITDVAATYPVTGNSATINPAAIPKLKQEVLQAQSAKIAAVSGATYTTQAYLSSLQSALDAAKA